MSKTMEINGATFEVIRPRNPQAFEDVLRRLDRYAFRSVYDCYDRPSDYKVRAYEMWHDWYSIMGEECTYFGVSGYNSMQFTLQALYEDETGVYEIRITRDHNRAILIVPSNKGVN